MREIITIHFGYAGNVVGSEFWKILANEHAINADGKVSQNISDRHLIKANTYFNSASSGRYVPRALLMDFESETFSFIRKSKFGALFRPSSFYRAKGTTRSNWARCNCGNGSGSLADFGDLIRAELETCDNIQGFQLMHSVSGGCGGGYGTLVLKSLRDEYSKLPIVCDVMVPSRNFEDHGLESINAALSFPLLADMSDLNLTLDREAIKNLCFKAALPGGATIQDQNELSARVFAGTTTSIRFPASMSSDLSKLACSLVPKRAMNFAIQSIFPIKDTPLMGSSALSTTDLMRKVLSPHNMCTSYSPQEGKYVTSAIVIGNDVSLEHVQYEIGKLSKARTFGFVKCMRPTMFVSNYNNPTRRCSANLTASMMATSTSVSKLLQRLRNSLETMCKYSTYLHNYLEEGMEIDQLRDSISTLNTMINDYVQMDD
ncbi:hypothetical protein ACOME3_009456 [Neoechinorhynchus agilis]